MKWMQKYKVKIHNLKIFFAKWTRFAHLRHPNISNCAGVAVVFENFDKMSK